jgi:hypothetical protein
MTFSVPRVRHYLREFTLEKLFVEELGWDRSSGRLTVQVDGHTYALHALAEKRGVQIFQCQPDAQGTIPDYAGRRKIEKQVTKLAYEHLLIYIDTAKTMQVWQWVARQPGQPAAYREHHYHPAHQSGDALIQKLEAITFLLSEEEGIDLAGVVFRLRDAFDRDQITRRFYDHFKREHATFLGFIKGITAQGDKEWYASLMLNRLMFVYFIQRKGFLDADPDYLKNRLKTVQQRQGRGNFLNFYRYFLLRLFHEGFAQQPAHRAPDLEDLLGDVPYLNGGLFELHALEQKHTGIDIPDEAFERLFAFFDQYEWHLDTRPLRNDREINPDVLGYIFEKYINQKQMGAYYTKEDITGHIAKNTIIPYLFDAAEKKCSVAFQPDSALWRLLQDDPDHYIYEPVRKGADLPLPEEIARGISNVSQRGGWNRPAAPEFALPTETWRESVARRQHCLELREKLRAGDIHQINGLITYNLDIRQFAEDVISTCEGPELLRTFWQAITTVTVLDPACGSGAFLFAALNILESLYEACLDRMQAFVDDLDRSGERPHPKKFADFRRVLTEIERHPNRRYFILKSIIVTNLYGVDIMEEAVEICKLRLFLTLVAQVDRVKDLEPLPDIDFNIRPGNTLVGFVSIDEIRRAAERDASGQGRLIYGEIDEAVRRIEEDAEIVERAFGKFQQMQTDYDMDGPAFTAAKQELRSRLRKLADELDRYLAGEYGINPDKTEAYEEWRQRHQPFHWFAEFYGIMSRGGVAVAIGNPPYVGYTKIKSSYTVHDYVTEACENLFTFTVERSVSLLAPNGRFGMIVPLSSVSTPNMIPLQQLLLSETSNIFISNYSGNRNPSVLFNGVEMRLSIILSTKGNTANTSHYFFTTCFMRWYIEARGYLFQGIRYSSVKTEFMLSGMLPKYFSPIETSLHSKIFSSRKNLRAFITPSGKHSIYAHRIASYFVKSFDFVPYFWNERDGSKKSEDYKVFSFRTSDESLLANALLNSTLFYWFYIVYSDTYHCGRTLILEFPIDLNKVDIQIRKKIIELGDKLKNDMRENKRRARIKYRGTGWVEFDKYYPKQSKAIIDEIDEVFAKHYGFTDEELDFIINYDTKYRMGQDDGNEIE